ncbi:chromodomain-helicase-DNA-binding protein 2-like isoform X2 [Fagus crenata]
MLGVEPKRNIHGRVGVDARKYREWLRSRIRKDNVSEVMLGKMEKSSHGDGGVAGANASKEVEEGVAEYPLSKRQRVDSDSKQQLVCITEPSHALQSISLPCLNSHLEDKTDGEDMRCVICMRGGKLLCCDGKGCKRRYHLSCLDPPLNYVPPGVWHCVWCVKKKIEMGVHSVSEEVESIWDAREVASDHEVLQRQKQYFVKYRGLAHVHNSWIPETQLLIAAPKLVAKFNIKSQIFRVIRWKEEWTVPHRLLQKRMLLFPKQSDEFCDGHYENNSDCHYEWLVKWTGLGYEHATWELDKASFFMSPESTQLISDYESRHKKAERLSSAYKGDEEGKSTICELRELSLPGEHRRHLSFVNKLRERWHKGHSAIVVDEHAEQDLQELESIEWEAIIIDQCQRSKMSKHFEQIRMLAADMRILLISGQIKDCPGDYINLLSLLDSGFNGLNSDNMVIDSSTDISILKERVAEYIASECKSGSSRFVEYWVPVQLSNVQLEQYCATLLSNSIFLSSCLKSEPADALRDIIISARKCCDHPYLLHQSLQSFLTKDLPIEEYLDVGIKISGKLKALDKILLEIRNRGLRVLILFQSIGGSGRDSVGDTLDYFIHQRFGRDSCVRIDGRGYARSKKQAALNMFNDKKNGKFVFLLENRACLPSIKLSSVDTVILFGSDWDPQNDLRALHRISISSQFEQLKVFRLYSSCTVEEKVLILAKEGMALDSNIHSISSHTCHTLLNWGASYLFNKLDEFHGCDSSDSGSNMSSEQTLLHDVLRELSTQLPYSGDNNDPSNYTIILKVPEGGVNARDLSLLGERKMQFLDNEPPSIFWTNLLEGRSPQWKFLLRPSQRIRRKVQYLHDSPKESEYENGVVTKKSRKMFNNSVDTVHLKSRLKDKRKLVTANNAVKLAENMGGMNQVNDSPTEPSGASNIARVPEIDMVESREQNIQLDVWKTTQFLPKLEMSKLCEILLLPENVKDTALRFLKYMRKKFNVGWKEISTLQAFQISLCWVAASLSKHSIDHKKSIALAKLHLNYDCKEEEADYIYSELQKVTKKFARRLEKRKKVKESHGAKDSKSTISNQQDVLEGETERSFQSSHFLDLSEAATGEQGPDSRMVQNNHISNSMTRVLDICERRMENLIQHQQKEVQEFHKKMMEDKVKLEEEQRLESALICTKDHDIPVRLDKLGILDHNFKGKMDENNHKRETHWKTLEASQLASRIEHEQMKANVVALLEKSKPGGPTAISGNLSLDDSEVKEGKMQQSDRAEINDCSQNAGTKAMPYSHIEKISCNLPREMETISIESDPENNKSEIMASKRVRTTSEWHNKAGSSNDPKNGASELCPSDLESPVRNAQIGKSVGRPGVPHTLSEVVIGDEPMKILPHAVHPAEEFLAKDAVTLESTTVTEVRLQNRAVTAICKELPALEFNGTCSSLVQPDTCLAQGNSLASEQLPIFINPSSTRHNLASIPGSVGIQHHQSSGSCSYSQEALTPMELPLEDLPELSDLMHPIMGLPPQPFIVTPVSGSEHLPDRSRTNVPGPVNYHTQVVPVIAEMPQPVCLNPLQLQMEGIQKDKDQGFKIHKNRMLQLTSECDKEIEEIRKKYDLLIQDAVTTSMQEQRDLETFHDKVYLNKLLADAFILMQQSHTSTGSLHEVQAALSFLMNQWFQLSSLQPAQMTAPGLEQCWAGPQMNIPPVNTTPFTPFSNALTQFPWNLQNGSELRAHSSHLQALLSPSLQTAHVSTPYSWMPNLQSPTVKLPRFLTTPPVQTGRQILADLLGKFCMFGLASPI